MRKIIVKNLIIVNVIMHIFTTLCFAENGNIKGFNEKFTELFMGNYFSQNYLESLYQDRLDSFNQWWPEHITSLRDVGMITRSEEEEYQLYYDLDYAGLDYNNGLKITLMQTNEFMKQYAESGVLGYLFSDEYYWAVFSSSTDGVYFYDRNGIYSESIKEVYDENYWNLFRITNTTYDILGHMDRIQSELIDNGEKEVIDIKLFAMQQPANIPFMYIKTDINEYLIRLTPGGQGTVMPSIECGKLYAAEKIMSEFVDETGADYSRKQLIISKIKKEKNTYETEAQVLQKEGLLKGNENGLDLLKPLTRAEAVTLLVRASGEEDQTVQYTASAFSDISSDNWAAPYASLAKAKGIAAGVSETEFAPDNRVTSDQFATFVLRAAGETNVDYTQATQLLIDRGIITAEEAETMDLFTRGDMAKIIYEAREKGLLT